jgi:hypothetical protein
MEGQRGGGSFDLSALVERIQYAITKYKAKLVNQLTLNGGFSAVRSGVSGVASTFACCPVKIIRSDFNYDHGTYQEYGASNT